MPRRLRDRAWQEFRAGRSRRLAFGRRPSAAFSGAAMAAGPPPVLRRALRHPGRSTSRGDAAVGAGSRSQGRVRRRLRRGAMGARRRSVQPGGPVHHQDRWPLRSRSRRSSGLLGGHSGPVNGGIAQASAVEQHAPRDIGRPSPAGRSPHSHRVDRDRAFGAQPLPSSRSWDVWPGSLLRSQEGERNCSPT